MRNLLLLMGLLVVFAAGCADVRRTPPDFAALRGRLGQAPCIAASLLIKVVPAAGEGELFTLQLWAAPDGRVRVLGHKLDVDFLTALVAADGTYTAVLPRAKAWTRGRLGGAAAPGPLRDLALLVAELRAGPVPAGDATATPTDAWRIRDPASGWTAELTMDQVSGMPTAKRILAADGAELRRLDYGRWATFDSLIRPNAVTLHVAGDDATYAIRVKSLEAPPAISAERMALAVPADAFEVAVDEFVKRMGE